MKSRDDRFFYRFWLKESGLSNMLILLSIMHFVLIPIFGSSSFFMILMHIFWMLFLFAGIFSLAKSKRSIRLISIIPCLFIIFGWINVFSTSTFIFYADFLLTIATFGLVVILVLMRVFEPGPITKYRVIGSIVVYMLLANIWSVAYMFLFEEVKGSFQIVLPVFENNSLQANFLYFSYITLTSTGFGDILPLHPLARSLVQAETVVGVLYPVILIGHLVSNSNVGQITKN